MVELQILKIRKKPIRTCLFFEMQADHLFLQNMHNALFAQRLSFNAKEHSLTEKYILVPKSDGMPNYRH